MAIECLVNQYPTLKPKSIDDILIMISFVSASIVNRRNSGTLQQIICYQFPSSEWICGQSGFLGYHPTVVSGIPDKNAKQDKRIEAVKQ